MDRKFKVFIRTLLAVFAVMSVCGCGESPEPESLGGNRPRKVRRVKEVKSSAERGAKKAKKKKLSKKERAMRRKEFARRRAEALRAGDESLPPKERKIAEGLQKGLDDEDLASVAKFSLMARESGNRELRSKAVDALNWFGKRALSNLTAFLNDPDEDIASEAMMAWEAGLFEIEDDVVKRDYLETALTMLSDREMLDSLAMNYNMMDDQGAAVESLVKVIESGNEVGVEIAKETYEFITGEEWKGKGPALKWASENRPEPIEGE